MVVVNRARFFVLEVHGFNVSDRANIDQVPVVPEDVSSLRIFKHDQPEQVDQSNLLFVLRDLSEGHKLIDDVTAHALGIESLQPNKKQVYFDL